MSPAVTTALAFVGWLAFFYCYHGLGITLGYHRLLTHKSLQVPRWFMYLIVSGGYLCLMNGPIVWVGVHRLHHQKSDLPGDPHSPRDGFYHALVGWMSKMEGVQSTEELQNQCRDLMKDPLFRMLGVEHESKPAMICLAICIIWRIGLTLAFGWPCLIANMIATLVVFWSPQLVNTVCHMPSEGYRTFETKDQSRNVWWVGLMALGEGWHNNHHAMPTSARHGMQWFEFDLTWYFTLLFEKLGLAKNVIRPSEKLLDSKKNEPVSV
jgi:stearoyl-CoA desaturase (delta-9 desaturase)